MSPPASYFPAFRRAADGLDTCPLPPKQARSENGECGPSTTGQGSAFQPGTELGSGPLSLGGRPSGGKEAPRATGPMSPPEEGAERTKHSKTRWGAAAGQGGCWPPDGHLTRASAFVFSPLSQEGNRRHPRSLQGSSRPSQEPSDSKVRPQAARHLWDWARHRCAHALGPYLPHPACAHRPGQGGRQVPRPPCQEAGRAQPRGRPEEGAGPRQHCQQGGAGPCGPPSPRWGLLCGRARAGS